MRLPVPSRRWVHPQLRRRPAVRRRRLRSAAHVAARATDRRADRRRHGATRRRRRRERRALVAAQGSSARPERHSADDGDARRSSPLCHERLRRRGSRVRARSADAALHHAATHATSPTRSTTAPGCRNCRAACAESGHFATSSGARNCVWNRAATDALRWLLGAFYFEADETQRFHFSVPGIAPVPINDYTATAGRNGVCRLRRCDACARRALARERRTALEPRRAARHADVAPARPIRSRRQQQTRGTTLSWRLGLEFSPARSLARLCECVDGVQKRRRDDRVLAERRVRLPTVPNSCLPTRRA